MLGIYIHATALLHLFLLYLLNDQLCMAVHVMESNSGWRTAIQLNNTYINIIKYKNQYQNVNIIKIKINKP